MKYNSIYVIVVGICYTAFSSCEGFELHSNFSSNDFAARNISKNENEVSEEITGTAVIGESLSCMAHNAGGYGCDNCDLESFLPLSHIGSNGAFASDIWGWKSTSTGKEYAIITLQDRTSFIDVTIAKSPKYLGFLASVGGTKADYRDSKTYGNYLYISAFVERHGLQVFDLTQLDHVSGPPKTFVQTDHIQFNVEVNVQHYRNSTLKEKRMSFKAGGYASNIFVHTHSQCLYVVGANSCQGGLTIFGLSTPRKPKFISCYSSIGFTEDVQCVIYNGPHTHYKGKEICFASNQKKITIVDTTQKNYIKTISYVSKSEFGYIEQGWLTEDHNYFLMSDAGHTGNTKTYIVDVRNLSAPVVVSVHFGKYQSKAGNQYIRNGFVYQANYKSGIQIYNTKSISTGKLSLGAYFDTYGPDNTAGFDGAMGIYPFFSSKKILVSSRKQGLFVINAKVSLGNDPGHHSPAVGIPGYNDPDHHSPFVGIPGYYDPGYHAPVVGIPGYHDPGYGGGVSVEVSTPVGGGHGDGHGISHVEVEVGVTPHAPSYIDNCRSPPLLPGWLGALMHFPYLFICLLITKDKVSFVVGVFDVLEYLVLAPIMGDNKHWLKLIITNFTNWFKTITEIIYNLVNSLRALTDTIYTILKILNLVGVSNNTPTLSPLASRPAGAAVEDTSMEEFIPLGWKYTQEIPTNTPTGSYPSLTP